MKTLIKITLLTMLLHCADFCIAQKTMTDKEINQYVKMMDTASSADSWKMIGEQFEKLTLDNNSSWLLFYHASFAKSLYAMRIDDMKLRDQYLDDALNLADKADALKRNESEIYVLRGMITAMKISVDIKRGMKSGPESAALLNRAKELNPQNPRVYLELGESAMYTPQEYGGGKNKAEALLETSVSKYKVFKPATINSPDWGEARAKSLLEKCKSL